MEKDWQGYRSYKCNMETAKKIHESLQKRAKNNHYGVYWNDWIVLWMDDYNMTVYLQLLAHIH